MKRIFYFAIISVLSITLFSCGKKEEQKVETKKKLPIVKYMEIKGEPFTEIYRVIGTVKPFESAKLSSEEGGLISDLKVDKGSRVGRGQVVIRLLKDQDQAQYQQAFSQYELAKDNYDRIERLYNDNATTEQLYKNAKLQLEIADKSVEVLKVRLRKGYITSPINGVVDGKFMNKGEMTGPGVPILSIVDISRVKISAGIPEKFVGEVSKGQSVKITFDVLPDEEFTGVINYLSPTLSSTNRTFEIEIILDNRARKFKPEMSASITITKLDLQDAVVLDQDMIVDNVEEKFVFVLEGDIAKKRVLKLGGRNENKVLIEDGLKAGDKMINVGFQEVVDGDKVQIAN